MTITINQNGNKECKLVIFDLDGTLHSFDDIHNYNALLKKHIIDILITLKENGIKIALASLNSNANVYLDRYKISEYFDYIEYKNWTIHGKNKTDLFQIICEKSNVPFQNMLLFDDNLSHCKEASLLEIKSICVDRNDLLTWTDINKGFKILQQIRIM
jgi:HAD superfamily phosphatase (TIGR01681 family)